MKTGKPKSHQNDTLFWLCCVGVLVNVGLALFGPVSEMGGVFVQSAGLFGLAALAFYVRGNTDDR